MRLNPNHNIIQLTFFSLSVAALCLLTVALKGNRVQAAQNQKIAKSIRLMPHMKSIRQADSASVPASPGLNDEATHTDSRLLREGRRIFRFDTFGDEAWWGDTLQLHRAIEGEKLGGVGPGVGPSTALAVGLKVDADALPPSVIQAIERAWVVAGGAKRRKPDGLLHSGAIGYVDGRPRIEKGNSG